MLGNLGFIHKEVKMKKTVGYTIAGVGVLLFALSYPALRNFLKIPSMGLSDIWILIIGLVILAIGALIIAKGSKSEQAKEIPIYEGQGKNRKIVGIQRIGK